MEIKLNSSKLNFTTNPQKLMQNLLDFNFGSAFTEIIDINASVENKAFYLLYNVTQKTNVELSKELGQEKINTAENLVVIFKNIESEWKDYFEQEITITKEFFQNVILQNPTYLSKSYQLFEKYLTTIQIDIPDNYYYKYYTSFRENLSSEFQLNKTKYIQLVEFFDNPVQIENEKFNNQIEHYKLINSFYTSELQAEVNESKETLQDLYIEPNFGIYKRNLDQSKYQNAIDFIKVPELDLHAFLNGFFLKGLKYTKDIRDDYNMIFILGQPGQGKTSFCYRVIHDVLSKANGLPEVPLFFIKIRDLHARDFIDDTFTTINNKINQSINFNSDKCLLILDGLDEAYMSGGLTDNDLKILYERLNSTCKQNKNLKVILTSRLNYLNINDPSLDGSLVVKIENLSDEQVKEYMDNFSKFYPQNVLTQKIDNILNLPSFKHIKELFQQPVLIYFIALSNIDVNKKDSRAAIYNKIFDSLAKRSWDKNGQLDHIKIELKDDSKKYSKLLRQYIRNIAFEIYQSKNLHISLKVLSELPSTKLFIKKCFNDSLEKDSEKIKEISKYLLISFYFQQSSKNSDEGAAIEFFHNSLWEYLTAEYIWEENKRIMLNSDEDGELKQVSLEEYFNLLNDLVGDKLLNDEIIENLENIILNEEEKIKTNSFEQSENLFYKITEFDYLLSYDWKKSKLLASEKNYNIFLLSWILLYHSGKSLNKSLTTNGKINNHFFGKSPLAYRNDIKNIIFTEQYYNSIYFNNNSIRNVHFKLLHYDALIFMDNKVDDSKFEHQYFYSGSRVQDNKFKNTDFTYSFFTRDVLLTGNVFNNCRFVEVQIPNQTWYTNFLKNNKFDSSFSKNHKLVSRIEENHDDKKIKNYYIVSKKEEEE